MISEIGIVAGDIWHYLEENGLVSMAKLVKGVGKPREIVLMGLGWLAREGHVKIDGKKSLKISLVNK